MSLEWEKVREQERKSKPENRDFVLPEDDPGIETLHRVGGKLRQRPREPIGQERVEIEERKRKEREALEAQQLAVLQDARRAKLMERLEHLSFNGTARIYTVDIPEE